MAKSKKPAKKRAAKYDPPLLIKGQFGEVIKVAMRNPDKPEDKAVKRKND